MNHRFTAVCAFLLIAAMAWAKPQNATQDKTSDKSQTDKAQTDKAQIVSTAEILKVDAKKQTLQVKNLANPSTTNPNSTANPGAGRRQGGGGGGGGGYPYPGGGGGRRRTGGGGGYPYPGGGGGGQGGGGNRGPSVQTASAKEYKVYVTKDTQIKLANATLDFNDLHVGDRIAISGLPKGGGGDLEATTIIRDPQ
jgi:hypothetical protein